MFQEFRYEVELTFTEEILGTQPNNKEIYGDYIASKAPDATTIEDEIAAVGVTGVEEKGMTVFPRDEDGKPFIYDYQIRGFFKDACSALQRCKKSKNLSSNLKAYKKVMDGDIFVEPRKIKFETADDGTGNCQRPLRASTLQGDRVALASSESISAGTKIRFTIVLLDEGLFPLIEEWLEYGRYKGLGQWRNSGKGKFTYRFTD